MLTQDNSSSAALDQRPAQSAERPLVESEFVTIGDISRTYGVSLRALRFYEERQLLQPVRRGMARLYDGHARARLELIIKGKQLGFTLTEIRAMLETGNDPAQDLKLALAPAQVLDQIAMLERQRADIDVAIRELRATQERLEDAIREPAPRRVMMA
ncbi:MAG: hypothetical protein JWL62_540 [Hyphomicrobiales bacterium]|nr:hypothetical protein [Hyphomicrobiales bacterium]